MSKQSLLISNEVIRTRARLLEDQVVKWGTSNVVVTNNDPRDFSRLKNYFDVIVVDAPCSGSGLFRRDPAAIQEWSTENVQLCSRRQRRILADVWPSLKNNGLLVYSTCSYSKEEDEDIADWIRKEFSVEDVELDIDPSWRITGSAGGYRFWPDQVRGEGFYMIALRKMGDGEQPRFHAKRKLIRPGRRDLDILNEWIPAGQHEFVNTENSVYAWPLPLVESFEDVMPSLRVLYSGTRVGQVVRDKLVPDHALALSGWLSAAIMRIDLDKPTAIAYLGKKEVRLPGLEKGWYAACYAGHELGWINVLGNRINNYYPKQLRILKDAPGRE
jgi:NOL1/NOP2/fmu family ribosome biogenesis protein